MAKNHTAIDLNDPNIAFSMKMVETNPFMQWNGIVVEELDVDHCICSMELRPEQTNPNGYAHGGVLFTIADVSPRAGGWAQLFHPGFRCAFSAQREKGQDHRRGLHHPPGNDLGRRGYRHPRGGRQRPGPRDRDHVLYQPGDPQPGDPVNEKLPHCGSFFSHVNTEDI